MNTSVLLPLALALAACTAASGALARQVDMAPVASAEASALQERQAAADRAHRWRMADALAATGGARELAFAAFLRAGADADGGDPQAAAWRRSAAGRAGSDVIADLWLLQLDKGDDAESAARRQAAAARWAAHEPGNLAPLLRQGLPIDALLVAAHGRDHVDHHMYEGVRWIVATRLRHPWTAQERALLAGDGGWQDEETAAVVAMGIWAAASMPGYDTLVRGCSAAAVDAVPARRGDCRHIATLLAGRSDSLLDRGIGLEILAGIATAAAERADIDQRRRRMDWQMQRWGEASARQPRDGIGQFVRLLQDPDIRGEPQLVERVLQEAGVPLDPPAGWSSPWRR